MTQSSLGFFIFIFLLISELSLTQSQSQSQRRSSKAAPPSSTSASQVVDFDCPEEFGYYPHPSDCTQYYVCVFGGALLESCTGGLMYSHELQTCDWPRNVGCGAGGELVSTVSSVKTVEPRQQSQRQPQQRQQQQQQHLSQQFPPPQRQLQREEAIPKHHLYTEEDLGPAEEVESDRQQRVYRGQPATLGQVARDRDGLNRHSNALQVAPANGREKLSVISFGTQQQYSRQSISPPAYVEQTTTQRVTSRGYNSSQQQQYTPSPYDPYYNIYEDDADLYKDIDYSQYTGQQNHQYQPQPQPQPTYKEKPSAVVQQQVQSPPSRKPSVQYSPPPPQPSYNAVQQDVYPSAQDYNDNYSLQDEDIDYKQSDLDLKGNRSRTAKRHETTKTTKQATDEPTKPETALPQRNKQITLTAAFTFDNDKTPVTSSRQRSSINSFLVEDPPSSGPIRDTHDLVLSYIKQENAALNKTSTSNKDEERFPDRSNSDRKEYLPKIHPKPFSLNVDDLDTSQISSTSPPRRGSKVYSDDDSDRPFRIIVPSSTPRSSYEVDVDQVTLRSRQRAGVRQQPTTPNALSEGTVRPYKLPPLNREIIESLPIQQLRFRPAQNSQLSPSNTKLSQNNEDTKQSTLLENDNDQFRSKEEPNKSYAQTNSDGRYQEEINGNKFPSINDENITFRNSNSATRTVNANPTKDNRQYLPEIPSTVESIVKLIPITAVRSQSQSRTNENDWLAKYQPRDSSNVQPKRISPQSYQVTEEPENSPDSVYLTAQRKPYISTGQSSNENNANKDNSADRSNKRIIYDNLTTERSQQIFMQTTEKSPRNPLYSLRIDKNNGKYIGNINGLVVATLETITNKPIGRERNVNDAYVVPAVRDNSYKQEEIPDVSTKEKLLYNENNEQSTNNSTPNSQIRIRIRGRQPTEASNNIYSTTTIGYENEPVTSGRSRNHIKQNYNRFQYSTENTILKETDSQRTEPLAPVVKDNFSKVIPSSEPTRENLNYNSQDDLALNSRRRQKSNLESKIEESYTHHNNFRDEQEINHKRRQLKNNNRLAQAPEVAVNQPKEINFNSEEETYVDNQDSTQILNNGEKEQRNFELTNKNEDPRRGTKSWQPESELLEEDEESDDEIKQEREYNIRKMHIRKKIRVTTSEPQISTEAYDNDNNYFNKNKEPNENEKLVKKFGQVPNEYTVNESEAAQKESVTLKQNIVEGTSGPRYRSRNNERNSINRENHYRSSESDYKEERNNENLSFKSEHLNVRVDPYSLLRPPTGLNDSLSRIEPKDNERVILPSRRPSAVNPKASDNPAPILAEEINSYFKQFDESTPIPVNVTTTQASTTPYVMTTVERIRDKFRLGSFPKPSPPTNSFARKPSVEDNTPPPLPSDRCSQELDNESECNENARLRVRPTNASPDSQSTPGLTRGSSRNRGSATYTVSPNEADPPQRGTPATLRNRPTLKPSTSIVSKASEFIDIYRYPPSRPDPIYPTPQVDKTAAKCRKDVCLLPDCSCGGKDIPGDLPPEDTPQIVLLTFDDSVNDLNKGLYSDLFEKGRTNPNGCPISATFYVSHEWTDYSQVQNLYATGHEIASHSVSHSFGEQFSVRKWTREIAGQREILAAYGGVKQEDIRGMRAPFLAIGGNKMFKMLYDSNFTYDSSMPVYENKPPSWPYTLDYKVFHDCMIPPCPTRSYPGVWEVPMVMWQDLNGGRCSMGDACSNPPTSDGVYKMLIKNFERHFTSNRSPFGLFYHAAWFTQPHHKEGFIAFLDAINKMPEVWIVTNWQAIQWVRDPTPLSRLNNFAPFQCNYPDRPRRCNNPKVCNLWHKSGVRYMRTCQPCPDIYPWTGKSGVRNSRVDNEIINE